MWSPLINKHDSKFQLIEDPPQSPSPNWICAVDPIRTESISVGNPIPPPSSDRRRWKPSIRFPVDRVASADLCWIHLSSFLCLTRLLRRHRLGKVNHYNISLFYLILKKLTIWVNMIRAAAQELSLSRIWSELWRVVFEWFVRSELIRMWKLGMEMLFTENVLSAC